VAQSHGNPNASKSDEYGTSKNSKKKFSSEWAATDLGAHLGYLYTPSGGKGKSQKVTSSASSEQTGTVDEYELPDPCENSYWFENSYIDTIPPDYPAERLVGKRVIINYKMEEGKEKMYVGKILYFSQKKEVFEIDTSEEEDTDKISK
jgi:hypothetical protein